MISLLLIAACSFPDPGTVVLGVAANASSDAERYEVTEGRYWPVFSPNTNYYEIPVIEQRAEMNVTFAGIDGQQVSAPLSLTYIIDGKGAVIELAKLYGPQVDEVMVSRLRDESRNALNRCTASIETTEGDGTIRKGLTVDEIYGERKAELFDCAFLSIQGLYAEKGLTVKTLNLLGKIELPATIEQKMEERITASANAEKVRREIETTEAEGKKQVAAAQADADARLITAKNQAEMRVIEARGTAEADALRAREITPAVLRLKEIQNDAEAIEKWNGALPTSMIPGQTVPFITLNP